MGAAPFKVHLERGDGQHRFHCVRLVKANHRARLESKAGKIDPRFFIGETKGLQLFKNYLTEWFGFEAYDLNNSSVLPLRYYSSLRT